MSRQELHHDVEEAIKACDEALLKSFFVFRDPHKKPPLKEGMYVVPREEVEKIKKKLKNILR